MSAPVGQACTHSPQATQVEAPIGSSKSKTIFSLWPRRALPVTPLSSAPRPGGPHRAGGGGRGAHRIVEVEDDLLDVAAQGHADDVVDLDLAAGADAQAAVDA